MILGFGIDLCDIRRIEEALTRFGDRFANRCFTDISGRNPRRGPAAPPPMPNVSRPRRPVPRRSAQA